jgi:hypothetical protein
MVRQEMSQLGKACAIDKAVLADGGWLWLRQSQRNAAKSANRFFYESSPRSNTQPSGSLQPTDPTESKASLWQMIPGVMGTRALRIAILLPRSTDRR